MKQWDRMGVYSHSGQTLHGRYVYTHQNFSQSIFYIFGEFDGWLLGPTPDLNFGGIKNSHDRMCVHTHDNIDTKEIFYKALDYFIFDSRLGDTMMVPKILRIQRKPIHIGSMMIRLSVSDVIRKQSPSTPDSSLIPTEPQCCGSCTEGQEG